MDFLMTAATHSQKTEKFFGTDGVRGRANVGKLTPESLIRLGQAAGQYFASQLCNTTSRPSILIGRDTRLSGDMVEASLVAGLTSAGMDVILAGIVPTPAVALLTQSSDVNLGAMITASHNKYQDNGVKFFGPDGCKLSDEAENYIENVMQAGPTSSSGVTEVGRVTKLTDAVSRYIKIAESSFPKDLSLSGLKIVLDCANGAAYQTAPDILKNLGASVIEIGVSPDGVNINADCGSTHTALLSKTVISERADVGIALDGDADRLIMCDETGRVIDGDQLLGLMAKAWKDSGQLTGGGLVATVMSNLGLERFIMAQGLNFIRTAVGDRHVAARMRQDGYNLGGEQSGHVLMTDFVPTGDGTIAALQVLAEIVKQGKAASEVLTVFDPVPQLLENVRYAGVSPLENSLVQQAINNAQTEFGTEGRILVRASGTEPLIRVMAEGDNAAKVKQVVNNLVDVIKTQAS
jgi:phosphoglucosamine mutase